MESSSEETKGNTVPLAGGGIPDSVRFTEEAALFLNSKHNAECVGCAGWKGLYEDSLARLGKANADRELAETRVEIVTLDHVRDRRELRDLLKAANEKIDQYRALVAQAWQVAEKVVNMVVPVAERFQNEVHRLAEAPDAMRWVSRGESLSPFPPKYGPGPRSGHLNLDRILGESGRLAPSGLPPELRRSDSLPGMVPGSRGDRVVKCGQGCAEGHSYSAATGCLLAEPRRPEQELRHPMRPEGRPEEPDEDAREA